MGLLDIFLVTVFAAFQQESFAIRFTDNDNIEEWGSKLELLSSPLKLIIKRRLAFRNTPPLDKDLFELPELKHHHLNAPLVELEDEKTGWPYEKVKFTHPIQSPVDVITGKAVTKKLPLLDIIEPSKQQNVKAKFYNSGSTVYLYFEEAAELRPYLIGGPLREKFVFQQLHFHWGTDDIWGSEHFVDGESFAVEIHMVYFNSIYSTYDIAHDQEEGLVVLTIFAEATDVTNPLLEPLHNLLGNVTVAQSSVLLDSGEAMQWAASALSLNSEYYTYPGSLTTKPYTENVVFIILPKPITLSHDQLNAFRNIEDYNNTCITDNKRKLQPLHNRPIVRGTDLQ